MFPCTPVFRHFDDRLHGTVLLEIIKLLNLRVPSPALKKKILFLSMTPCSGRPHCIQTSTSERWKIIAQQTEKKHQCAKSNKRIIRNHLCKKSQTMEPSAIAQQSGKRNIKNITEKKSNEVFVKEHISHCQKLKKGNIRRCSKIKKRDNLCKIESLFIHSQYSRKTSLPPRAYIRRQESKSA